VAAHAPLVPGYDYRTISYVVDFLAEAGVALAATGETISLEGLLPDLQEYIDWSFANPDDPQSSLGLLIGSGHELEVPDSAPSLDSETLISPLASLMILADILLGVEGETSQQQATTASVGMSGSANIIYASDLQTTDNEDTSIKGLITIVELSTLPVKSKTRLKGLIAAYEAGNRLATRFLDPAGVIISGVTGEASWTKLIKLSTVEKPVPARVVVCVLPEGTIVDSERINYTLNLLGPASQLGQPLYPDADAELDSSLASPGQTTIELEGHRLIINAAFGQNAVFS
jgi:hypothetical protein